MLVELPLLVQQGVKVMWKLADLDLVALADKYWVHGWHTNSSDNILGYQSGLREEKPYACVWPPKVTRNHKGSIFMKLRPHIFFRGKSSLFIQRFRQKYPKT